MKTSAIFLVLTLAAAGCRTPPPLERSDPGGLDVIEPGDPAGTDAALPGDQAPGPGNDPGTDQVLVKDEGVDHASVDDTTVGDAPADAWPGQPVPRECGVVVEYTPGGAVNSITLPGEWNGWDTKANPLSDPDGDGTWSVTLGPEDVPPGEWGYKLLVDGEQWMFDPANPLRKFVGPDKTENSRLVMPDCGLPLLVLKSAVADPDDRSIDVVVEVYTGVDGGPLDPGSLRVTTPYGDEIEGDWFDPVAQVFHVVMEGLEWGKHSLLFLASNAKGQARLYVPLWLEQEPFDWRDAVMYFAMTDRFNDGDQANDAPAQCDELDPGSKANWLGGDFEGIRRKIEDGYFDSLGVNAIWISPANDNADGCYSGSLGLKYAAYHGYFPVSLDTVEPRFGGMEDLRAMVRKAHEHGIRVLMDLAANHVHIDSPVWTLHKDWFHQEALLCPDDDNWTQHPVDCWFMPYLPDFDFQNLDAESAVTDAAVKWAVEADLDGFRVDAVKHMIHDFTRTLRYKVEKELETTSTTFYLVGETFDGKQKIKEYVSDIELHGQFDFPLYWSVLGAFARDETTMSDLGAALLDSLSFYGTGALMSNFLGNHDVSRFISHAAGDIPTSNPNAIEVKQMAWDDPPELPSDADAFSRLEMAFAFLMTIPGIPLIYYGDEIGLPGAADPDNRRMMTFDGLTDLQKGLRDAVGRLAVDVRAAHPAARRGEVRVLWSDDDGLAYAAFVEDDALLVVLNRGPARSVEVDVSAVPLLAKAPRLKDVLDGVPTPVEQGRIVLNVGRLRYLVLSP